MRDGSFCCVLFSVVFILKGLMLGKIKKMTSLVEVEKVMFFGILFTGKKITSTVAVGQGLATESLIFLHRSSFIDKSVFVVNYLSSHLIMKYETTLAATDNKNVVIMVATLLSVAGLGLTTQPFYTHKNYFSIDIFLERFLRLCYHNRTS